MPKLPCFRARTTPTGTLPSRLPAAESLTLVESFADLTALSPRHVLWVAAPEELSDEEMVAAGHFLGEFGDTSIGIITGSTRESARALWLRARQADGTRAAYAIAKDPRTGVGIAAGLVVETPEGTARHSLTKESFVEYLTRVDYMTFAGHGGAGYLGLPDYVRIGAGDLPPLPPIVVATASCNTLRPWAAGSIALDFVDKGAVAYAGFVYSPISGYLLGQYRDLAYRHTWPGFTVGEVIAVQNRGTLKSFASFPYFFLIGDPRLHLRAEAPYQLTGDRISGDERMVQYEEVPAGVVPVRIRDGAGYGFAEIPGVGSFADDDPFYNGRVQAIDRGGDKLMLVVHQGGPLVVQLRRSAPWHRAVVRPVIDALDHNFVYLPQTGPPPPASGLVVWLLTLIWGVKARKERERPLLVRSFFAGVSLAAPVGFYLLARSGDIAVTSKAVTPSPWVVVDLCMLVAAAAYIFLVSRSWRGRVSAVAIGSLPALGPALFSLVGITAANYRMATALGVGIYSHHMGALSMISTLVLLPILIVVFSFARAAPLDKRESPAGWLR